MANTLRRLGVMIDMSRNAVMKPEEVIRFARLIGEMGYDMLMLYTEDTYEIPEEPYFGYLRGRYSEAELRSMAEGCRKAGVELVPCIQTLAHLGAIMRWPRFQTLRDTGDILLAAEEETYRLIDRMFATIGRCFQSRLVNIGMDEAHMVGLGEYLDRHGFENRYEILTRHLHRVCQIAESHGLHAMMWSDMFFRLANHGKYASDRPSVPDLPEGSLPKNLSLIYWEYYSAEPKKLNAMLSAHQKLISQAGEREDPAGGRGVWFAGGAWSWTGFAPHNAWSIRATRAALSACEKAGVDQFLLTMWGDHGGECSRLSLLPTLFAAAKFAQGHYKMSEIRTQFKERYGIAFDAFMKLDLPALSPAPRRTAQESVTNFDKICLYNDPFLGIYDPCLQGDEGERYRAVARSLSRYKNDPRWGLLFKKEWALARVLANKATLGLELRRAYQAGDTEALQALVTRIVRIEKDLAVFRRIHQEAWLAENKPYGFEVQDLRLGGLAARLETCKERLTAYLSGAVSDIPELTETLLPPVSGPVYWIGRHQTIATVNPV